MPRTLVTGVTGHLGRAIAENLLTRVTPSDVLALARDPSKAVELAGRGVEVRRGDYSDPASLQGAFRGVERLVLVSAVAFSDAVIHHRNVIEAARTAGVRHLIYTGVQRADPSRFVIDQVTHWERETERELDRSGLAFTLLRNGLYFDALPFMLGSDILSRGLQVPAGLQGAAFAAREELGEAAAIVAAGSGHEGRTYTLSGGESVTMAELADVLSGVAGRRVPYVEVPRSDFVADREAGGLPGPVAMFLADWFGAIRAGEFAEVTGDLERILGRRPLTAAEMVPRMFGTISVPGA